MSLENTMEFWDDVKSIRGAELRLRNFQLDDNAKKTHNDYIKDCVLNLKNKYSGRLEKLEERLLLNVIQHFSYLNKVVDKELYQKWADNIEVTADQLQILDATIVELDISVRLMNAIKSHFSGRNISQNAKQKLEPIYLGDLVQVAENDLCKTQGIGKGSIQELKEEMAKYGLTLGMKINYTRPENR
jgi:DNA-directed RNA polymerase alpha subunit